MLLLDSDRRRAGRTAASDPQALIEEARRRTRRRRSQRAIVGLLAVAAVVVGYALASRGGAPVVRAETAATPFANLTAFSGRGELAFVSRGALWVIDGESETLRRLPVPRGRSPESPVFSRDGHWLAWVAGDSHGDPGELWLAHGDGTGAHRVRGIGAAGLVGWSPTADQLAVVVDGKGWDFAGLQDQRPVKVELVAAHGTVRLLVALSTSPTRPGQVESVAWSPNGDGLAVSVANPRLSVSSTVSTYPVSGGKPTVWFSIAANKGLPGICSGCGDRGVIADLAGWWPRWGIAFWVYCCGGTRNLDNTPLEVLTAPGAQPRLIAQTLSVGITDAVAAGRGGELSLVSTTGGGGRVYSQGKAVETCTRSTLICTELPDDTIWSGKLPKLPCLGLCGLDRTPPPGTPGSAVSLEPAWSPDASRLAYVLAPTTPGDDQTPVWYAAHELFVWNKRTGSSRKLATISGVSVPTWSRNGRDLLYVSNDGLWLAPVGGGKPVEIEAPLFPERVWESPPLTIAFNGQIHWTGQFNWWSP